MIHQEMDIDEWILLSDDRFPDINQDAQKQIHGGRRVSDTNLVFLADYFNKEEPPPPKQLVPVPFPESDKGKFVEKIQESGTEPVEGDREVKTQVSFRKPSYNNESVDMTNKMDSPRSTTKGAITQLDAAGKFNFDEEDDEFLQNMSSPRLRDSFEKKAGANWEENSGPGGLWKWSLTGIGAICSFGVAAAAFCIIVFGTQQRQKQHQQNQKLLFQRYTDHKRMKQVVHHTTKLDESISAARGVPITRAHITFGGYYDGI
ncbi:Detected protein of unknown function [Hibiscus syriacus]|uniref:DUF6821 domain-containing protein n=1 Tax=Hibiscus syriacus TaxID=106335 RepID=A0A6A3D5V6_HIBSY|nr:uncharacterized protein LOC120212449 [Hibiscus syriacus]XP_039066683.1 uncharacterized protein LOC120212449 [Hibiscus syriacus]KAE8734629.1 Detected protein of unknown function [Hibiscus syriacus]